MFENPESSTLSLPTASATSKQGVKDFLSNLAYENHGLRLGIEFSLLVFFHSLFLSLAPWEQLGVIDAWQGLYSWFSACFFVAFIDRYLLSSSVFEFRKSVEFALKGELEQATNLLNKVAPNSTRLVRCPPILFNLQRTFISIHAGDFQAAEESLQQARALGLPEERYVTMKIQLCAHAGDYEMAHAIYDLAKEQHGDTAILSLERAFVLLTERKDWRSIKRAFIAVLDKPVQVHASGEHSLTIANAFVAVSNLWTGRAEEGLDELNLAILNFSSALFGGDSCRPITSLLLLERSLYLATHQEPQAALRDLANALRLCALTPQQNLADRIKAELQWRHGLTVDSGIGIRAAVE